MKSQQGLTVIWWFILGGLSLMLPFLYTKSQSVDNELHLNFIREIAALKELNVSLKETLTETRLELQPSYDGLVYALKKTVIRSHRFQTDILEQLPMTHGSELGNSWQTYKKHLVQQAKTIEAFKSHYAVLKNSIHYLPVIVNEYTTANAMSDDPSGLKKVVHALMDEILIMNLDRGFEHFAIVRDALSTIRTESTSAPNNARETLLVIILHVETIIKYKEEVDDLLVLALNTPMSNALNKVLSIHFDDFNSQQREAKAYAAAAFAAAALLILMVAYVLYWLNLTSKQLKESLVELSFQKYTLDQHAIVSIADSRGRITYINDKFHQVSGYTMEELLSKNHRIVKSDEHSKAFFKELWQTISSGNVWHGEIKNRAKNGSYYWVSSTIVPFMSENGRPFQYVSIRTDITERKNMELDLSQARDEAQVANKMKSEFLANMSHEIRTPMNAIIGLSYLTQRTSLNDKQKDYLSKILSSANSLLGIINDILDITKVEAGKMTIEKIPFKLEEVLEQVMTTICVKAEEKGLAVKVTNTLDMPDSFIGDPVRLKQVLINIIDNAIKFTEKGSIHFTVKEVDSKEGSEEGGVTLRFEVKDTGIGLSEAEQKLLFRSFSQADGSTTRKYGGTGLGLAICKNLVELMGGEIGVDSEKDNGSVFYFTINFMTPLIVD